MTTFKISFGEDLRRFQLPGHALSWAALQQEVVSRFALDSTCHPTLRYKDPEGDVVSLSSDGELKEAVLCFLRQGQPSVRLELTISHKMAPAASDAPAPLFSSSVLESTFNKPEPVARPKTPEPTCLLQDQQVAPEQHELELQAELEEENEEEEEDEVEEEEESDHGHDDFLKYDSGRKETVEHLPQAAPSYPEASSALHEDVICDACRSQIRGTRYKCGHCPNFDLCESCDLSNPTDHPRNHLFIRIPTPLSRILNHSWYSSRLLLPPVQLFTAFAQPPSVELRPETKPPTQAEPLVPAPTPAPVSDPAPAPAPTTPAPAPARAPEPTPAPTPARASEPKYDSRFLEDVSIPDGTVISQGSSFTKTWKMMNNGKVKWPVGTHLQCVGGDPMSKANAVIVPAVGPGQNIDISAFLTAPSQPGRYVSHWRLVTPDGVKFGHRIWCDITVPETLESPPPEEETYDQSLSHEEQSTLLHAGLQDYQQPDEDTQCSGFVPSEDARYDAEMKKLVGMGFAERSKNLRLLRKHQGNLNLVIEDLLADRDSGWCN